MCAPNADDGVRKFGQIVVQYVRDCQSIERESTSVTRPQPIRKMV